VFSPITSDFELEGSQLMLLCHVDKAQICEICVLSMDGQPLDKRLPGRLKPLTSIMLYLPNGWADFEFAIELQYKQSTN